MTYIDGDGPWYDWPVTGLVPIAEAVAPIVRRVSAGSAFEQVRASLASVGYDLVRTGYTSNGATGKVDVGGVKFTVIVQETLK